MSLELLKKTWPEWKIDEKKLGQGSYGVVYKAKRSDHGVESDAAIKVITVPTDVSEVDSLRSEGLDDNATRTYLQGVVDNFVSEIQLIELLKGIQNIVSVEDYKVIEKQDEIGWTIIIRMELLTSLNTHISTKKIIEDDVIKLGINICNALEICEKKKIIHGRVNPNNIFVNKNGDFQLEILDFIRSIENTTNATFPKGINNYESPEIFNGLEHNVRADIYSLGMVLYRLLNKNKLPYWDLNKQLITPNERDAALSRRLSGEALPPPCEASEGMANIILRACAYDPAQRFASASEMKTALHKLKVGTYIPAPIDFFDKSTSQRYHKKLLNLKQKIKFWTKSKK